MKPTKKRILFADAALIVTAAIWGINVFIVKDILASIDPFALIAQRFLVATLLIGIFLLCSRRLRFDAPLHSLGLGCLLWLVYIFQMYGIRYATPVNAVFIDELIIFFTPMFYFLFWGKRSSWLTWGSAGVAIVGFFCLIGGLGQIGLGDLLIAAATVVQSFYLILVSGYMNKKADPVASCFLQFLVVGCLSLVVTQFRGTSLAIPDLRSLWIIIFLILFPTLFAFLSQLTAQKYLSPVKAAMLLSIAPIFTLLVSALKGTTDFSPERSTGIVLILGAVLISSLPQSENKLQISLKLHKKAN